MLLRNVRTNRYYVGEVVVSIYDWLVPPNSYQILYPRTAVSRKIVCNFIRKCPHNLHV